MSFASRSKTSSYGLSSLLVASVVLVTGCASHYAQVAPRLDLGSYDRIGLVTFSTNEGKAGLGQLATQRFGEEVLASQTGFELMELGPADSAVARLLAGGDAGAAAQELGRSRNVPAVFFGQLVVTNAKPHGSVGGGGVNVGATVSTEMVVRLVSTSSGGTLWRSSAAASQEVGQVAISTGRLPSISGSDPNSAYAALVSQNATSITRDLRPTWVKQ